MDARDYAKLVGDYVQLPGVPEIPEVTAIRNAGATSQMILLPGNNWTSAQSYVSSGSAAALGAVTNPDGTKTGLIFDVHKYLDSDNSYVLSSPFYHIAVN